MKVNSLLIEKYLSMVTESRMAMMEDPASDLTGYDDAIDNMGAAAKAAGDERLLRVCIDALIANPEGRLFRFAGSAYRWPNDEFVALLTYAFERLWPGREPSFPGDEADIEFVPMSTEEWDAYNGR
jgi:hypothetical protein